MTDDSHGAALDAATSIPPDDEAQAEHMSDRPLAGRTAIITGAATGIGRATALDLGRAGARVVINCKDETQQVMAKAVADEIVESGGAAEVVVADVRSPEAIRHLFSESLRLLGNVDIVVSNAAGDAVIKPIADTTEEDYDRVMALNAKGQFFVMQEAARCISDNGRIIVLSSSTVLAPYPGSASYSGAKRAAEIYAQVLAAELGDRNITVNVVAPGPTNTPVMQAQNSDERKAQVIAMTPLGRFGEPEDIADVIAFLVADSGRWVTRQIIQVGGGIA